MSTVDSPEATPVSVKSASGVSPRKRKTLHDFFTTSNTSSSKTSVPPSVRSTPGVSKVIGTTFTTPMSRPSPKYPPGLNVQASFITPAEEATLLAYLDTLSWRTDLARRTFHFGGTYCHMPPRTATPAERKVIESTIYTAPPLPLELDFLLARFIEQGLYTEANKPAYCIINEYLPGQGISAHVENFRFGEPVVALTLAGGDHMRFHELEEADDGSVRSGKAGKAKRTGKKCDVWLERCGLMVMRGEARSKWQHEIVRGRKGQGGGVIGWRRASLTFRTDVK